MNFIRFVVLGIVMVSGWQADAWSQAKPVTAFEAKQAAGSILAAGVRGHVLAIAGGRNAVAVTPLEWYVWFYDASASQNGVRVRVVGDRALDITQGFTETGRARMFPYKLSEVMPADKLRVDSKQVYQTVRNAPGLSNRKLSSSSFDLRIDDDRGEPVWTIHLWEPLPDGGENEVATARVSAASGEVLYLKIRR